eukprot:COSAG02_NODE_22733_length_741_cov_24.480952_1_plen_28_part_01
MYISTSYTYRKYEFLGRDSGVVVQFQFG